MTIDVLRRPHTFDAASVREDFPILRRSMHGKRLIYLDSAATSQKPQKVLDALLAYYAYSNANVHRGVYELAEEATAAYERARDVVASFVGAPRECTIFVRNATEAINLVAYSWGRQNIHAGDAILLSPFEHHSNLIPWQLLASETGAKLLFAELHPDGNLDLESVERLLRTEHVRLVALAHISNVLGTITPVGAIAGLVHEHDAKLLIDGAQAVPHMRVDVSELNADFYAFTGHKMLGPMGIGVLYGRRELLESMPPFLGGGEMIRRVGLESSTWNDLPWKFEAGTPSVGDAVALASAVEYLDELGMDAVEEHDRDLAAHCRERLESFDDLTVYGPRERGAVVAFNLDGVHPHDLASALDERGIAIRAGHHCAQLLHRRLGVAASARASFYVYNTREDVDALVDGLTYARSILAT